MKNKDAFEGWKEAVIAWRVCASIHREFAKGKDPFFKTRAKDFEKAINKAVEMMNKYHDEVEENE